jgi:DNA-directed RNA polymerase subunit RPC12/RpoP
MSHVIPELLAQEIVRNYVCSACYGHLISFIEPERQTRVECHRCGEDTPGFVTKKYTERRRSDSIAEKWEVDAMLKNIGVVQKTSRTVDQLFKELGF